MAMYGIAILPLIKRVMSDNVTQKWYADNGNAAGSIPLLSKLYHDLKEIGPHFGYKVIKCHLITKPDFEQRARDLFANEDVEVINGHRVLGSVIGTEERCQEFFDEKSNTYSKLLKKLSKHAKVAPQNVYKAFTNGVQQKLTFITRTTPKSEDLIEKTEKFITDDLIPSLVSHPTYNEKYRKIFSLPVRKGGLSILLPEDRAHEYERSLKITKPFENMHDHTDIDAEQMQIAKNIKREKIEMSKSKENEIDALLTKDEKYAIKLAKEKGASCWLNALPLKKYHFDLTKSEFRDGIALRYGWEPVKLPSNCACNEPFTVSHALHCPKGGYTHIRHNDIVIPSPISWTKYATMSKSSLVFRLCKAKPSQIELPLLMTMPASTFEQMVCGRIDSRRLSSTWRFSILTQEHVQKTLAEHTKCTNK